MRHPLVPALLFGIFSSFVMIPHTAIATPVAHTPVAQKHMEQGWSAWQRGAFEEAVQAWLAAAQRYEQAQQPRAQSDALTQLARAYQALGQYRKAMQNFSSALELSPTSCKTVPRWPPCWGAWEGSTLLAVLSIPRNKRYTKAWVWRARSTMRRSWPRC